MGEHDESTWVSSLIGSSWNDHGIKNLHISSPPESDANTTALGAQNTAHQLEAKEVQNEVPIHSLL